MFGFRSSDFFYKYPFLFFFVFNNCLCEHEYCYAQSQCEISTFMKRFLLYDVNPPEGFNLRRDVYMRFAILAHKLKNSDKENLQNFQLVLPPWSRLMHWAYSEIPEQIPWGLFFDLESLKSFAPVMEMHEFFAAINQTHRVEIDEVYILQHFEDMFESGKFEDKMKIDKCLKNYHLNYFFYKNISFHNIKCLSYHGSATKLSHLLEKSTAKIILLHHAEVALHDMFGNKLYWECRRSMRFNYRLRQIATKFRKEVLNSTDDSDNTNLPKDWRSERPKRNARGGPYLAVHLRRRDFLRGHTDQVPSINRISEQIITLLRKIDLNTVFISTDALNEEYEELVERISPDYHVVRYNASEKIKARYGDGGIAIIDQIICSHARYFVGTHESTFSFRIQEEREILGFPVDTTFNSFCKYDHCPQPSKWEIVY